MPPKKRNATGPPKKKTRIKLTQDLSLTPEEEQEVRTAFEFFTDPDELGEDSIQTKDLRKAFSALGFNLSIIEAKDIAEAVDLEDSGLVSYELFLEVAAMKIRDRDSKAEVDKAFSLFTGGDDEGPITFAHLKKVAKTLNENVSDDVLREMLSEASSGVDGSVVSKRDFEAVMRRAGVL